MYNTFFNISMYNAYKNKCSIIHYIECIMFENFFYLFKVIFYIFIVVTMIFHKINPPFLFGITFKVKIVTFFKNPVVLKYLEYPKYEYTEYKHKFAPLPLNDLQYAPAKVKGINILVQSLII